MISLIFQQFDGRYYVENKNIRINPITGAESDGAHRKLLDYPTTLGPNFPREASPTGKSGVGYTTYSVDRQPVEQIRSVMFIMQDTDPIINGRLVATGVVDPYANLLQLPTENGYAALGQKWR